MNRHLLLGLAVGGLLIMLMGWDSAFGHHSFAAFDQTRQITLAGTVKEFQWSNPHSWLQVLVKNQQGEAEEWAMEMLSPSVLGRMGWKRNSLKPGDTVSVVFNPMRDGSRGGNLVNVTVNGKAIGGTHESASR